MRKMNQSELNRWIGSQIYKERIAQKISQEALSEASDVSRNFISMLENGNKSARIDTYYRIACALDISLCELFCDNRDNGASEILLLLNDCSDTEVHAFAEILRASKKQLNILMKEQNT